MKFRKLKRYILLTFLVALCIKIRSDYNVVYDSVDEYSLPREFFSNGTARTVPGASGPRLNRDHPNAKNLTSDTERASKANGDQTLLPVEVQQENSGTGSGSGGGTDAKSDQANGQQIPNPLFKKMMEKREEEKRRAAELLEAAKQLIRDHRSGKLAAYKKKIEAVQKSVKEAMKSVHKRPIKVSHDIDFVETSLNETERTRISLQIQRLNEEQLIYNREIYGPLKQTDTVVLVQVHNRLENLRFLVDSLIEARNVSSCLVIFSHDFYDEDINDFIRNITEFRVMQIFFPFSIQLYPNEFPGRNPKDCAWNYKQVGSKRIQCLNEKWKDTFGHYREATFTQIKHHWWWKFLRVFKELRETRDFEGSVLFLEEDHFISPDTFYMLNLLKEKRNASKDLQKYLIFGLGNYLKVVGTNQVVFKAEWIVNKFNMGFALDRRVFDLIYGCSSTFCHYDDYNWDWTLASIAKTCADNKMFMLYPKMSRVFHIGSCGTHYKGSICDLEKEVRNVRNRLNAYRSWLFPPYLDVSGALKRAVKPKNLNGGWGDIRDQQLCLAMTNGTASQILKKLSLYKSF